MQRFEDRTGTMRFYVYPNKSVMSEIKAYGARNGQTIHQVLQNEIQQFYQMLINKATEIRQQELERIKQEEIKEEEQRLARENPIKVNLETPPIGV